MIVANFDNKLFQQSRQYLNDSLEKKYVKSVGWRFQKLNYARYVNILKQVSDVLVLKVPVVPVPARVTLWPNAFARTYSLHLWNI